MRAHAAAVVILGAPSVIAADEEAARTKARVLFNEGLDLRAAGDHRGALAKFKAADATYSTPKIRLELAREHAAVGALVEAVEVLQALGAGDDEKYAAVRVEAAKLSTDLDIRIPRLTVVASGAAAVTVDGRSITSGVPTRVNPGKHVVIANHDGTEERREIDLAERANLTVRFELAPPAKHGSSMPASSIILFAVGGSALVVGGAFAWSARSTNVESRSHCGLGGQPNACDDEGLRLRSTAGTRADVATVSIVLGGVALAGAVALWAWSPRTEGKTQTVSLGIGAGFAQLTGSF